MARRRKIGDVYAIPLPDGTYAFGRVLLESSVAFYKHRGKGINDLPPTEDYEFTVGCYKDCFKEWTFVENRPFDNEDKARPPLYQMKDIGTENYKIYDYGNIRHATKEECAGLEVCAVWANTHLVKRLMGDEIWKKYLKDYCSEDSNK